MLRLETTRSGHQTLTYAKTSIHSRYDPVREADRFAAKALEGVSPSSIVLLGPGLGHVVGSLKRRSPTSRVIGIYYDERIYNLARERPSFSWHPGIGSSLESFLRNNLIDEDGKGLKILNWGPSTHMFPDSARHAAAVVRRHVRELTGNYVTVNALGRLWIRNSVLNFIDIDTVFAGNLCHPDLPTIVAASGPSLESGISALRDARPFTNLWALPSAVPALNDNDISPDLVIMTDPGHYSIRHLESVTRQDIRLAMPLSAARGAWHVTNRISLLCQSNFFEQEIIDRSGISVPRLNAMGTVAASALDILLSASRSKIVFCGLDLCYLDIRSHARPNTSDDLWRLAANRLTPHYSQAFHWAASRTTAGKSTVRTAAPLDTYAGWFAEAANLNADRLYRLNPPQHAKPAMRTIDSTELLDLVVRVGKIPDKPRALPDSRYPGAADRVELTTSLIRDWLAVVDDEARNLDRRNARSGPFSDPRARRLAYFIDLDGLTTLDQEKRSGRGGAVRDRAYVLTRSISDFLGGLLEEAGRRKPTR